MNTIIQKAKEKQDAQTKSLEAVQENDNQPKISDASKPQNPLMSEAEMLEFIDSLLGESGYHPYAMDGFIFMLETFSSIAEESRIDLTDLCAVLIETIYTHTFHQNVSRRLYTENIRYRYRETDYTKSLTEIHHATGNELGEFYDDHAEEAKDSLSPETAATPKTLDLPDSPIEDLARKLSDIMHDPNLPDRVFNLLNDEFAQSDIDTNSPENILFNLKEMLEVAE